MSEHKICQELVKDCPQPCQLLQRSERDGGGGGVEALGAALDPGLDGVKDEGVVS